MANSPSFEESLLREYNLTRDDLKQLFNSSNDFNNDVPPTHHYCSGISKDIMRIYKEHYHGCFSLIICTFGTMANLLNVAVLTRKDMAVAPINRLLTGLAVADMLVMIEYMPFAYYHYIVFPQKKDFTYIGAIFVLFHMNFTNVLHNISICLTIALAVWRYITIRSPQKTQQLCSDHRCTCAICISYLLSIVLCLPYYFMFSIVSQKIVENNTTVVLYKVDLSELAHKNDELVFKISFWVYSVNFKLLPCVILTVISFYLIKALYNAKQRKQILRTGYDVTPRDAKSALGLVDKKRPSKSERRADRTTRMLVAVLLLFLITEVPQGIMALLSVLLGKEFFVDCYNNFGEVMDMLALLNGAINFILYCSMSRQFRTTFGQLFKPKILNKFASIQTVQTSVLNTYV